MGSLPLATTDKPTDLDLETAISPHSEAAQVEAARRNPAAFSALYRRYVSAIYRYLYQWVNNAADAEDLTSQVFSEALEGLAHYQERGTFAAWLFTIARRKAIAFYRGRCPGLPLEAAEQMSESAGDPLDQVVQGEQRERMQTLYDQLDDDQRELLRLRFTAGLSYAQIGEILGRREAAVKMAIYRLLRQMNAQWEE